MGCPVLGPRPRRGRGERRKNFACGGRKLAETLSPFFYTKNAERAGRRIAHHSSPLPPLPGAGYCSPSRSSQPISPRSPAGESSDGSCGHAATRQSWPWPPRGGSLVNANLVSEMRFAGHSTHAISACWGWGGAGGGGGWGGAPPSRRQRGWGWVGVPAAQCAQLPHRPSQGNTTQVRAGAADFAPLEARIAAAQPLLKSLSGALRNSAARAAAPGSSAWWRKRRFT